MADTQVNIRFENIDLEAWTASGVVSNPDAVRRLIDDGLRFALIERGVSRRLVQETEDVRALFRKLYDAHRTALGQPGPLGNQFVLVRVPVGSPYFEEGAEAVVPLHRDLERLTKAGEIVRRTEDGWTTQRTVTVDENELLAVEVK